MSELQVYTGQQYLKTVYIIYILENILSRFLTPAVFTIASAAYFVPQLSKNIAYKALDLHKYANDKIRDTDIKAIKNKKVEKVEAMYTTRGKPGVDSFVSKNL